jgi:hypothetical protein
MNRKPIITGGRRAKPQDSLLAEIPSPAEAEAIDAVIRGAARKITKAVLRAGKKSKKSA